MQEAGSDRPGGRRGFEPERGDFYEKEITFQVSCSYGPGRYDEKYEQGGQDYPIGFVRWTEQRNFEAVLEAMRSGPLRVKELISHRFSLEEAEKAYELITENKEPYIGIILGYNKEDGLATDPHRRTQTDFKSRTVGLQPTSTSTGLQPEGVVVGLIGAGNFTGRLLLPALQKTGARLQAIASSGGISGTHLGKKFGFEESTTDTERIFADSEINVVFIATRHNTHADFVLEALKAGKHVFVEKPLCITLEELGQIVGLLNSIYEQKNNSDEVTNQQFNDSQITSNGKPLLMVGFNRRFAPHIIKMKELLETVRESKSMIMTVNAGKIPPNHWTQDLEVGGGRIIGEACHFVDLLRFLAGVLIKRSEIFGLDSQTRDTVSIQLKFADGSIGTIHYFANGSKRFPKERLEVFAGGRILQLNNFRKLAGIQEDEPLAPGQKAYRGNPVICGCHKQRKTISDSF